MPLILCHSPKGGVGTSFVAAHLALALAAAGRDVTALDLTGQDGLKLWFGLNPAQTLPDFDAEEGPQVGRVALRRLSPAAREKGFIDSLRAGLAPFSDDTIHVVDVAAGDQAMRDQLMPYARLQVCVLAPTAHALASLARVQPGTPPGALEQTVFVLNQIDDTRRLSRHTHSFLRELLGDQLIGTVRRDEAVNEAPAMCQTLARYAPASVALADVALLRPLVEACAQGQSAPVARAAAAASEAA